MVNEIRPAPFVLISSNHGAMIINRNDYVLQDQNSGYGVGFSLMNRSCADQEEILFLLELLRLRRRYYGDGVVAIDCGANIGTHTVEWARAMYRWGEVYSFEAQEKIFYALAGNVVLNNCLNVAAKHCAVGASNGFIMMAEPNYNRASSFGSFELVANAKTEYIGQSIDYDNPTKKVSIISLDSLELARVDLVKIDVEGMEEDVLIGAQNLTTRHRPILSIEIIKSNKERIAGYLEALGYVLFPFGMNLLAVHQNDPLIGHVNFQDGYLNLNNL